MAYTFSRRSFLKYTALSAVVLAGASVLSGCEITDPNNPVSTKLGTKLEVLQTQGTLSKISYHGNLTFDFKISTEYSNGVLLRPDYFSVKVITPADAASSHTEEIRYFDTCELEYPDGRPSNWPLLKSGETVTLRVRVPGCWSNPGDTIVLKYIPVNENHEMSMSWEIKIPADLSSSDSNYWDYGSES